MTKPIVMLGECSGVNWLGTLQGLGWGRMFVHMPPAPYEGELWGWDNGAFALHTEGGRPKRIACEELERWEDSLLPQVRQVMENVKVLPLVAVCPDLPFNGSCSLSYSIKWIDLLSSLPVRWPWYLAVQDGMDPRTVRNVLEGWNEFDGIFLGGSSHFKYQAGMWAKVAKDLGKKFHYGRCGTPKKLRHAMSVGADSLDSALPMWTKAGLELFIRTWRDLAPKQTLFDFI